MTVISVRNPYTGEHDYEFTQATAEEIKGICARLRQNQPEWEALGLEGRIAVMDKLKDAMAERFDALYQAVKTDTGRSEIAQLEAGWIPNILERLYGDARAMLPETEPRAAMLPGIEASNQYVPYQLVGNISPWNFPLLLSMVDTLPALICGSAVVLKPSEVTPRFAEPFADAIAAVPELEKVFRIILGPGETGAELINHVDIVAFTGSVRTGRKVAENAARNFIPVFLELGGKDPAVVLESANVDVATSSILRTSVGATGQACQSLERIYVAEPIYDEFVDKIVDKAQKVTLNTHQLEQGHIGPLIFEKQADTIEEHLEDAKAKGAKVLTGGKIIRNGGNWIEPTVLVDVTQDMKVITDETFGPVIPISKFKNVEEAIFLANDTRYGLSASVYGAPDEAYPVARQLNGGAVSINEGSLTAYVHDTEHESFGFSGMGGTRFGPEGIRRFIRRKALFNSTQGVRDINGEFVPLA